MSVTTSYRLWYTASYSSLALALRGVSMNRRSYALVGARPTTRGGPECEMFLIECHAMGAALSVLPEGMTRIASGVSGGVAPGPPPTSSHGFTPVMFVTRPIAAEYFRGKGALAQATVTFGPFRGRNRHLVIFGTGLAESPLVQLDRAAEDVAVTAVAGLAGSLIWDHGRAASAGTPTPAAFAHGRPYGLAAATAFQKAAFRDLRSAPALQDVAREVVNRFHGVAKRSG